MVGGGSFIVLAAESKQRDWDRAVRRRSRLDSITSLPGERDENENEIGALCGNCLQEHAENLSRSVLDKMRRVLRARALLSTLREDQLSFLSDYAERLSGGLKGALEAHSLTVERFVTRQRERAELQAEVSKLAAELEHVQRSEGAGTNAPSTLSSTHASDMLASLRAQAAYQANAVRDLGKSRPLNDAFFVWHSEGYGTINGHRLGYVEQLSASYGNWCETNVALGEAALLLTTIARLSHVGFRKYVVLPLRARSLLRESHDPRASPLRLYYLGGGTDIENVREGLDLTRALVAFVECIVDVYMCAVRTRRGKDLELEKKMYPMQLFIKSGIVDATIRGISISALKQGASADEREKWVKSMKYILVNMKWLLAWAMSFQ